MPEWAVVLAGAGHVWWWHSHFTDVERISGVNRYLFAEKLLANADRWLDNSVMHRDLIDLLMMQRSWGPAPQAAWDKAIAAYGESVRAAYQRARQRFVDRPELLAQACTAMGIEQATQADIARLLTGR